MGYPYIESARALGAGDIRRHDRRHVVPNIIAPLIVLTTLYFSQAILAEATLSFLGLGTQPPRGGLGQHARDRARLTSTRASGCRSSRGSRS